MGFAATTDAFTSGVAYIDGGYRPVAEANISILDWGFNRSDVTYDVVHVVDGAFFRLNDHIERFLDGLAKLRLDPGLSRGEIVTVLHGCVALSGLRDSYVEMLCTRGKPPPHVRDLRLTDHRFIAYAIPYISISGERPPGEGLHASVASTVERIRPEAIDPTVKNFHWGDLVRGMFEAYDRGAEEVILTDGLGKVTEGPGFNVFAVVNGLVRTPQHGVLLGITRRTVLEICQTLDIRFKEGPLEVDALMEADEIFVTSTAGGVMPVTTLDGELVGVGQQGALTERIRKAYWDWHLESNLSELVDYDRPPRPIH